jgi:serine/threonine-protein kinase
MLAAVFRDACRGLAYAHTAVDATGIALNIVHRDATPHNLMVRKDGTTKVVDFGVAKAANRAVKTSTGVLKGKLQYMPPEQVRGEPVTPRSDQWALGASLWEMLVGRRLIHATEPMDVFRMVLAGQFPPASSVVADVPPELDAIVNRMLAADPALRFASCDDAADALDEFARRAGFRHQHVAEFVTQIAGSTIDAVTKDLTPQPVHILGFGGAPQARPSTGLSTTNVNAPSSTGIPCAKCGTRSPAGSRFCNACGSALAAEPVSVETAVDAISTAPNLPPGGSPSSSSSSSPSSPAVLSLPSPSSSMPSRPLPAILRTPGPSAAPAVTVLVAQPSSSPPLPSPSSLPPRTPEPRGPMPRLASAPSLVGVGAPVAGDPRTPAPRLTPSSGVDLGVLGFAAAQDLQRAVVGERRRVVVIRASLAGAMAPEDKPELADERKGALLAQLQNIVDDEGGATESLESDNLQFAFGLEKTSDDDATAAVRAAMALDECVRRSARAWNVPVGLRAAVDVGAAVVAEGPPGRRLSGPVKDRAARIERRISSPRVLVSLDVQRLVRRAWETAAPFTLKDDGATLEVAQVVGPATVVERDAFFVGRRRELAEAARAAAQRPSQVFFTGGHGSGRSALLNEIARQTATAGLPMRRVAARRAVVPWGVARELLLGPGSADARPRLARLPVPVPTAERLGRMFFPDVAARRGGTDVESLSLDELAVVDALAAVARGGVLLIDDWGNVDAGSRSALARLAASGTDVALVATALSEDRVPEGATRTALDPLGEAELHALCAQELRVESLPAAVVSYVVAHCGGNPSLAKLVVEGLVEARVLQLHGGRATVTAALTGVAAPGSLLRAWETRFDRLTPETRTLLRAAAVVGNDFSLDVAAAMMGVDGQLRGPALLQPAVQAGLVEHVQGNTFAFTHAGLRDAIRGRMLPAELAQQHRRALELLAAKTTDDDVEGLQALWAHAGAARDDVLFVEVGARAARALLERGGRAEAVDVYRRILDVIDRMVRQSPSAAATLAQLVHDATMAALPVDSATAAAFWARHAEAVGPAPADLRAWALRARGLALVAAGNAAAAVQSLDQALELVPEGDDDTRALFLSDLGGALEAAGDVQGAVAQMVEAFGRAQGRPNRHPEFAFEALNRLGRLYLRSRLIAQARDTFQLATQTAAERGDEAAAARALTNLGTCAALEGKVDDARLFLGDAIARAEAVGDLIQSSRARLNLGRLLLSKEPTTSRDILTRALADAERAGWKEGIALGRSALQTMRV